MKFSNEIKTGILVLTGIVLFIIGFSFLKSNDVFTSDRFFYAIYDDVEGVTKGTPVTISGFSVGSVQKIQFFKNSSKLIIKFRVENDLDFSKNSIAQIYETGLIGGKAIAIIPKSGNINAKTGDTLDSQIAPGLTELVNDKLSPLQVKIESMVVSADSLLKSFNSVLDDELKNDFQLTIKKASTTMQNLEESSNSIKNLLNDNELRINNLITNIDDTSKEIKRISGSFSEIESIIYNLNNVSNNLSKITDYVNSGQGSAGKIIFDDKLIKSLNTVSKNINLLMEDLRLNPKKYVHFSIFGRKNKSD